MNSWNYQVRRATLDDIGQLTALWKSMNFPVDELSRRITEFQVATNNEGALLGALGLQMAERQGLIHGEAFVDFAMAEALRPLLWERVNAVAANHGLLRFWTQEPAPFWSHCGLIKADPEVLAKLPSSWRTASSAWLTIKLREDVDTLVSLDQEFARFMDLEKQKTQRAFKQARILKSIVLVLALGIFFIAVAGAVILLRRNPHVLGR